MIIQFPGTSRLEPPFCPVSRSQDLLGGDTSVDAVRARLLTAVERWLLLLQERPRVAMALLHIVERFLSRGSTRIGR